jgi:hypothetical protein
VKSRKNRFWMALATITGLAGLTAIALAQTVQDRLWKLGSARAEEEGLERPLASSFRH